MSKRENHIPLADRIGIGVSIICAIHCLLLPGLVALMPLWPALGAHEEWIHPLFLVIILPTVFYAARRSHYDRVILKWLLGGLILVMAGWLVGHDHQGIGAETGLTLLGSGALIYGHWRNYRHHQVCTNRTHHHHPVVEEILGETAPKGEPHNHGTQNAHDREHEP